MSQVQLNNESNSSNTKESSLESKPIIEVKDLQVAFSKESGFLGHEKKTTNALRGVSLELFPAETLSLIGESGSGKTTLARCVTALLRPNAGSVTYCGVDLNSMSGKELMNYHKQVQIIFQDPFESLNPFQDVLSFLSTPIRRFLGKKSRLTIIDMSKELLEEVGLEPTEFLHKYPHQLSGGEKQRVNIARALASAPLVLIADEPVSMLDASQRLNTLQLLTSIQKERKLSVLLITHDLAVAQVMKGRIAVMYSGKICETGVTDEVIAFPNHPYTKLLVSSSPNFRALLRGDEGSEDSFVEAEIGSEPVDGCSFRNRCQYSTRICFDQDPPLGLKPNHRMVACHNTLNLSKDTKI